MTINELEVENERLRKVLETIKQLTSEEHIEEIKMEEDKWGRVYAFVVKRVHIKATSALDSEAFEK